MCLEVFEEHQTVSIVRGKYVYFYKGRKILWFDASFGNVIATYSDYIQGFNTVKYAFIAAMVYGSDIPCEFYEKGRIGLRNGLKGTVCRICYEGSQILDDIYSDGTVRDFFRICEAINNDPPQDDLIETDCCLLVCCEPDKYTLT